MSQVKTNSGLVFTGLKKPGSVPRWASGYGASRAIFSKAIATAEGDEIIVIREPSVEAYRESKQKIHKLFRQNKSSAFKLHYVLSVEHPKNDKLASMNELVEIFPQSLIGQVDIALGPESLENSVWEAVVKQKHRHREPLAESSRLAAVTEKIRTESGRLSAEKVAKALGLSVAELSKQLSSTRQAVSKTPDSKALQPKLRPYERVIQLRSVMSEPKFKRWLNHSFVDLDGMTPLEVMAANKADVVADFAEDALLGTPS